MKKKITRAAIKGRNIFKVGNVIRGLGEVEKVIIQKDGLIQYRFGAGDWRAENIVKNFQKIYG